LFFDGLLCGAHEFCNFFVAHVLAAAQNKDLLHSGWQLINFFVDNCFEHVFPYAMVGVNGAGLGIIFDGIDVFVLNGLMDNFVEELVMDAAVQVAGEVLANLKGLAFVPDRGEDFLDEVAGFFSVFEFVPGVIMKNEFISVVNFSERGLVASFQKASEVCIGMFAVIWHTEYNNSNNLIGVPIAGCYRYLRVILV